MPMISSKAFGSANSSLLKKRNASPSIVKQMLYDTPGTYSWICPTGVTSVSVVAIGGGGGGGVHRVNSPSRYRNSGGGGGLAWINNYTVTPGNSYTVVVGAGGIRGYTAGYYDTVPTRSASPGGNSYFVSTSICSGWGGGVVPFFTDATIQGGSYTVTTSTGSYGGGTGGNGAYFLYLSQAPTGGGYDIRGGGGAGGYTGNGGLGYVTGVIGEDGSGTGGAGGGGGYVTPADYSGIPTTHGGGGGGVGVYGQGPSGGASIVTDWGIYTPYYISYGGQGGSGGEPGKDGYTIGGFTTLGDGGKYGGGGASGYPEGYGNKGGNGGVGAVRIIWGAGRAFPSTNTGDQFV